MAPRRIMEKFEQLTESERLSILDLREGGFFNRAIAVRVQRNSSTMMRVWEQWIDEHRTSRKSGNGRRKLTSSGEDQHLCSRTTSSRKLAVRRSTAKSKLLSVSSICGRLMHHGLLAVVPFYRINLMVNHRQPSLQCVHEYRAWQVDWH